MDILNLGNLFLGDEEDPKDFFWFFWTLGCGDEEYNNDYYYE